jgi:putative two-component system response regulator
VRVLAIDDSRSIAAAIARVIADSEACEVEYCIDPVDAVALCARRQFDMVLVDYVMPKMNGIEVVQALRASDAYKLVPIIMITSDIDSKLRLRSIEAGATDFLNKPFDWIELQARVRNLLALRRAQLDLADRARLLASQVDAATRHLVEREEELIWRLARAIEYRDGTTGEHISRVATISNLIARALGLDDTRARNIYLAAPLHDIGKIGVSDLILQKPGRLTAEEMATMRRHVAIGCHILDNGSSDLIRVAALIAGAHHERWDGQGYPHGLAGEDIPIEGRIVAVADVFDALCSARPYKDAWPIETARAEIHACAGSHFDPQCVDAFERQWPLIRQVMEANLIIIGTQSVAA